VTSLLRRTRGAHGDRAHVGNNQKSTERSIVAATPLEPAVDRGERLPQHGRAPETALEAG
jgi:hypothetical protein